MVLRLILRSMYNAIFQVKQVSEKSVLDQKAYILFYIRDSPTRSSVVTDQRLQSTLPAFKKLLSDGAAEVADDSSADDLDNNSTHRGSNAGNADGSLNRTNGIAQVAPDSGLPAAPNANLPSVKPAGNSQVAASNLLIYLVMLFKCLFPYMRAAVFS